MFDRVLRVRGKEVVVDSWAEVGLKRGGGVDKAQLRLACRVGKLMYAHVK